jgi:hypothetical protein
MTDDGHVRSLASDSSHEGSNVGSPHVVIQHGHLDLRMPGQKSNGLIVSASDMTRTPYALHPQRDDPAIGVIVIHDQHAPTQERWIRRCSISDSR